jgi:hypothetical protein
MKDQGEGAPLYKAVAAAYEKHKEAAEVSPAWLATLAMCEIGFGRDLHAIGYIGCHLQMRQIARQFLAQELDIDIDRVAEDDLFPETLQHRYPRARKKGEEPVYVLLDLLTDADVEFNLARMRKAGSALLRHADRFEAWHRERGAA